MKSFQHAQNKTRFDHDSHNALPPSLMPNTVQCKTCFIRDWTKHVSS